MNAVYIKAKERKIIECIMSEEERRVREVSRLRFGTAIPFEEAVASLSSDEPIVEVDVLRSNSRIDVRVELQ